MRRIVLAIILAAITSSALAYGLGKEGSRGGFGSLGSMGKTTAAGPLTPCVSTGVFDLSNVCNDIYFIGGLK